MDYSEAYGESKYIRSIDLLDSPLITAILSVKKQTVENPMKGTKDNLPVAQLYNSKPLIINKTNYKTISAIAKSQQSDNWTNKIITIIAVEDDRSPFGYAVRVKKAPENFKGFLEAATGIGDLKERYTMINKPKYKQLAIKLSEKWKKENQQNISFWG